jgi:hypothetical protein
LRDCKSLLLGELGTCQQNLISMRRMEPWKKCHFAQRGMLKFTYKGHFLTIKIAYGKFLNWKSKWWKHFLVPPLYVEILFLRNTKILSFGGIQSFVLGWFWQFWAVLGRFCCIGSGWQHAQRSLEILKTSQLLNRKSNFMWSVSLESYQRPLSTFQLSTIAED